MDAGAQQELNLIKNELQSILDELYRVAEGLNKDFKGIGNEECAKSVSKAASQFETAHQKLNSMNLTAVTEEFAARQRAADEAKARAEAEARERAEAEARAREAAAKAKEEEKKEKEKKQSKKPSDVLEDLFEWLFK